MVHGNYSLLLMSLDCTIFLHDALWSVYIDCMPLCVSALALAAFDFASRRAGVECSSSIHSRFLENVIKAPMSFYDTTPLGRIINRSV